VSERPPPPTRPIRPIPIYMKGTFTP
jgi:hypothetical protein